MKPIPNKWISLDAARRIVEDETGHLPSRQTMYNWVKAKKIQIHRYKPMRTTKASVLEFLVTRRHV